MPFANPNCQVVLQHFETATFLLSSSGSIRKFIWGRIPHAQITFHLGAMHLREVPLVAALQRLGGGRHRFNNLARPAQPSGHKRVSRPPWRRRWSA